MYTGKNTDENTMYINEYGYYDLIAEIRDREKRFKINTKQLNSAQAWKGKGKRKMPRT